MILCFSGTGNSRYIAKKIAAELQDEIVDVNAKIKAVDYSPIKTGENVVVVTPTYAWRIPRIVSDWLSKTKLLSAKRIWFVMNCGSEIGNASKYNRSLAEQKHLCYMGTSQIRMPENYIAMFDAPQAEEARKIVKNAEPAIVDSIACIKTEQPFPANSDEIDLRHPVQLMKDSFWLQLYYLHLHHKPGTCHPQLSFRLIPTCQHLQE